MMKNTDNEYRKHAKSAAKTIVANKDLFDRKSAVIMAARYILRWAPVEIVGNAYNIDRYDDWSVAAKSLWNDKKSEMSLNSFKKTFITIEHSIPVSLTLNDMFDAETESEIEEIAYRGIKVCVILHSEDALLKEGGFNSKMPEDWDGEDKFARYNKVGIEMTTF